MHSVCAKPLYVYLYLNIPKVLSLMFWYSTYCWWIFHNISKKKKLSFVCYRSKTSLYIAKHLVHSQKSPIPSTSSCESGSACSDYIHVYCDMICICLHFRFFRLLFSFNLDNFVTHLHSAKAPFPMKIQSHVLINCSILNEIII